MDQPWETLSHIRRKEYAIMDMDWIRTLLKTARYGVLATEASGQPFAYPRLFVYDSGAGEDELGVIYTHGAKTGRTWANLQENPRVCFNVSEMGGLLPAKRAAGFNVAFDSVVAFGEMHVVEDERQAEKALYLLLDKYFPESKVDEDYSPITAEDLRRTAVYRLDIMSWSGKAHTKKT